ncbi:hypothetical protein RPMD05_60 [Rhodobacteraceae phage LS06-2018-MD05]|nr:hypothetical protein RPMD05_60 [Rhodobacteraceae phage LS06-2018-MD05]
MSCNFFLVGVGVITYFYTPKLNRFIITRVILYYE